MPLNIFKYRINFKFILPLFIILSIYLSYQFFIPINNFPIDKNITIVKGQSESNVIQNLYEDRFIRNIYFAKVVSKLFTDSPMQIGRFNFDKPASLFEIMIALRQKPKSVKVTIPEGFTIIQIADRLDLVLSNNVANVIENTRIKNFDKKKFLENIKEGYIFPETYFLPVSANTQDVLDEFESEYKKNINKLSRKPSKDEVIIASMLQREVRGEKDMKLVSGIIQNRLKIGMKLQIDATVLYGQGAWKSRVFYKDLKDESDYNTYKNEGLPIGPISNPGAIALEAAMNPTKSKYLFYLTGLDGVTYFAETGEKHFKNINLYLR